MTINTDYSVNTTAFKGPLPMLYDMVVEKKLSIDRVSLSEVASTYLEKIKTIQPFPANEVAETSVIIATLMLIKARSLLPLFELTQEEEENVSELERRLKIYSHIKKIAKQISADYDSNFLYPLERKKMRDATVVFFPDSFVSSNQMLSAVYGMSNKEYTVKEELPKKVVRATVTLEEVMKEITERITTTLKQTTFSDFVSEIGKNRYDTVVSFLALLELVKQDMLLVSQDDLFVEISMVPKSL
ncbi:MAG: segregation/condensation protein A [Candidatus Campbellbacteria bacterium]|nr:segregation/condensation protein A [Candidatus Campbellbacteria bacterium]